MTTIITVNICKILSNVFVPHFIQHVSLNICFVALRLDTQALNPQGQWSSFCNCPVTVWNCHHLGIKTVDNINVFLSGALFHIMVWVYGSWLFAVKNKTAAVKIKLLLWILCVGTFSSLSALENFLQQIWTSFCSYYKFWMLMSLCGYLKIMHRTQHFTFLPQEAFAPPAELLH